MDLFLDATVRNCISDNESVAFFFYKFGSVAKLQIRINQNALLTKDRDRYEKVKKNMKIGQLKHLL